jgi:hypothetical protein
MLGGVPSQAAISPLGKGGQACLMAVMQVEDSLREYPLNLSFITASFGLLAPPSTRVTLR